MNSEENRPEQSSMQDQLEQSPERWIHPDTLKFMGMAKDLLESPGVRQSVAAEQQKKAAESTREQYPVNASDMDRPESEQSQKGIPSSHFSGDQPDTPNFMGMARDLLNSPAVKQATDTKSQEQ